MSSYIHVRQGCCSVFGTQSSSFSLELGCIAVFLEIMETDSYSTTKMKVSGLNDCECTKKGDNQSLGSAKNDLCNNEKQELLF